MALLALVAGCLCLQVVALDRYPAPWFDEGFRWNAARLFADAGVFGSRSATGVIPFDVGITSGPVEVLLLAASYTAFGLGVVQGRMPFVLLSLLSLLLVTRIGAQTIAARSGLFMAVAVAVMPTIGGVGFLMVGRQALSETPAMAMTLLGLWLWTRAWAAGRTSLACAAGLAFGLGLLSKSQFAIALLPALALVGAGRWRLRFDTGVRAMAPAAGALLVVALWWGAGALAATPAVQHDNSASLWQGIGANILTGLWGATLTGQAIAIAGICVVAGLWGVWSAHTDWRRGRLTAGSWLVITLAIVALVNSAWFALLSIGWPRYAYLGYIAASMLLGLALSAAADRLDTSPGLGRTERLLRPVAWLGLAAFAAAASLGPVVAGQGTDGAARMSAYIDAHVTRSAVIETWEWDLSGLGAHLAFHFPPQRYVYLATFQQGRRLPYDLPYDLLTGQPLYLVVGPFSRLTGIYPAEAVAAHFDLVQEIAPYTLYARRP